MPICSREHFSRFDPKSRTLAASPPGEEVCGAREAEPDSPGEGAIKCILVLVVVHMCVLCVVMGTVILVVVFFSVFKN